jgi:TDG/mug DNA glycosylase family protein
MTNDARRPMHPTKAEREAAYGREIPHVLAERLDVVFVGINPGLWSGATGHHFAKPGNRFWKALHRSGFTDRQLDPSEDALLPTYGLGVTNLVARTTARADELAEEEIRAGGRSLGERLAPVAPRVVAVVGLGAFRIAFERPKAEVGPSDVEIGGARSWVLPNPSGLNAHYQVDDLARVFAEMRLELGLRDRRTDALSG